MEPRPTSHDRARGAGTDAEGGGPGDQVTKARHEAGGTEGGGHRGRHLAEIYEAGPSHGVRASRGKSPGSSSIGALHESRLGQAHSPGNNANTGSPIAQGPVLQFLHFRPLICAITLNRPTIESIAGPLLGCCEDLHSNPPQQRTSSASSASSAFLLGPRLSSRGQRERACLVSTRLPEPFGRRGVLSANVSKAMPFCHSTRWKAVLEESSKG